MNNQAGSDFTLRMNFHPRHSDDKCISEEIHRNQDLPNNRDLHAIRPASEPVTDDSKGPELKQWSNPVPEEGLVLGADAIGHALAAQVSTNHFKHKLSN